MHNIGHNLNLAHSGERYFYGCYGCRQRADQSGMMGKVSNKESSPRMCFNAAKNYQLGWYSDKTEVVTPDPKLLLLQRIIATLQIVWGESIFPVGRNNLDSKNGFIARDDSRLTSFIARDDKSQLTTELGEITLLIFGD
jgi:hypothetical protein